MFTDYLWYIPQMKEHLQKKRNQHQHGSDYCYPPGTSGPMTAIRLEGSRSFCF